MSSKMVSKKIEKKAGVDAAHEAALEKIAEVAKRAAEFPGYMRFNDQLTFWQVMDANLEDGKLRVCRHVYVQVPEEKVKAFERSNPGARKMVGSNRERLAAFCKENDLPAPMGGTGSFLPKAHVEYLVLRFAEIELSPSLLNKHGKCTLPGLKDNAIVAVGIERATVRKEVPVVGGKGFLGTEMKDVTVEYRRIVAFVPPEMYEECEIPLAMDKHNDDRGDMAFFE
jgi:hypothetical protein